jgi:hypothetical protein
VGALVSYPVLVGSIVGRTDFGVGLGDKREVLFELLAVFFFLLFGAGLRVIAATDSVLETRLDEAVKVVRKGVRWPW